MKAANIEINKGKRKRRNVDRRKKACCRLEKPTGIEMDKAVSDANLSPELAIKIIYLNIRKPPRG